MFTQRKSIFGRLLGISSSGGLISAVTSTGGHNSTAFDMSAQMWGQALIETVSTSGAVMKNAGVTIVSTDSTSGIALVLAAPVAGVHKEIHFQTSATAMTYGTSSTTIYINTTLAEAAAGGSTVINVAGGAAGIGGVVVLRGLSTTQWAIVSHTVGSSS